MKLQLNKDLDVVFNGTCIDELTVEQKDYIRKQLADMLLAQRPKNLQSIAFMMMREYGEYEDNVLALNLKKKYTVADLDEIKVTMDLLLNAGMEYKFDRRIYHIAEYRNHPTLGHFFRSTPAQLARTRCVGKMTIHALNKFFNDQYGLQWMD